MRAAAIALAVLSLPCLADARPITVGASVGRIQSKANADGDASDTWQVFGRIGITPRLGAQLEVQKIGDPSLDVRSATGLLVVELANNPHLMPLLVAGFGVDKASSPYYYEATGTHTEGGFGLEYRFDGGLVIGGDVRLGGRSVNETYYAQPLEGDVIALYAPSGTLAPGEYRSARIYAAIRF